MFGEPAGVTGTAALKKACEQGLIEKDATVVSVVTGNGLKDVANAIKSAGEPLHIEPDLDLMVKSFAQRGVIVNKLSHETKQPAACKECTQQAIFS